MTNGNEMTPQQRAENIYKALLSPQTSLNWGDPATYIATQIEEAEREAVRDVARRNRVVLDKMIDKSYEEGFSAAKEQAAKKADAVARQVGSSPNHKLIIGTAEIIATNIRTMQPEEKP